MFIYDELVTLFVNLVNFGPVTLEFKIGKHVYPVVFFKIDLSDKLSQDPPDRFSSHFHHIVAI